MMTKIQVTAEVELEVHVMAKAFANMMSDEQAQFLALVYQEMGSYPGLQGENMGSHGRELQMLAIKDHFTKQPDARAMVEDLYEITAFGKRDCCNSAVGELHRYMCPRMAGDLAMLPLDTPEGATAKISPVDEGKNDKPAYILYHDLSTDDVVIRDDAAYSKVGDMYLGTVQSVDGGRVVVKVGPRDYEVVEVNFGYPHFGERRVGSLGSHVLNYEPRKTCRLRFAAHTRAPILGDVINVADHGQGRVSEVGSDRIVTVVMDGNSLSYVPEPGYSDHLHWNQMPAMQPFSDQSTVPEAATCDECKGTGSWTNPAGGRNAKSPCSLGCTV